MGKYNTLSEAVNELTKQGYTYNFNLKSDCIDCPEHSLQLSPDDFEIDYKYRFEAMSDVDNESVLYAISSKKSDVKGLLVNAYGIYADSYSAELVAKLVSDKRREN